MYACICACVCDLCNVCNQDCIAWNVYCFIYGFMHAREWTCVAMRVKVCVFVVQFVCLLLHV